jgi:hypothetical protein
MSDDRSLEQIKGSLRDIAELYPRYATAIERLEQRLTLLGTGEAIPERKYDTHPERKYDTHIWKFYLYQNLLIKLRILIENNFRFVETLSLLATARYVFEALVWIRVLHKDERYGLVAYYHLGSLHVQQVKEHKNKMDGEIQFYERLAAEESRMLENTVKSNDSVQEIGEALRSVTDAVDRRARREFNLYADQAKVNGYLFQAHLLREKELPRIKERMDVVTRELAELEKRLPPSTRILVKHRWNWKDRAKSVGMEKQYEFLYSNTSRMLHATPFSFAVNQKNLEFIEVYMFLEYIYVSLLDAVEVIEKDTGAPAHIHCSSGQSPP